jgi:hypothetical protein
MAHGRWLAHGNGVPIQFLILPMAVDGEAYGLLLPPPPPGRVIRGTQMSRCQEKSGKKSCNFCFTLVVKKKKEKRKKKKEKKK